MFQSTFGVENYLTVLFHYENLLTVFKISKTLHVSLKGTVMQIEKALINDRLHIIYL